MNDEGICNNNVERFSGFGELYDQNRPSAPTEIINILMLYLQRRPQLVVDVGCGTGLSTFIWLDHADQIVGVEPNDDMRQIAISKWRALKEPNQLQFARGLSHQLELASESADLVTCSQSFHWMEPQSSLREFARVLRPGGIFAAYDCDWPPSFHWDIEDRYNRLIASANERARQLSAENKQAQQWSKDEHLQQIRASGLFRYSREIVFHHWDNCDAARYTNIALSQGGLQTALKLGAKELQSAVEEFREKVEQAFKGQSQYVLFSYRMRLGMK